MDRINILLVEDEALLRDGLRALLKKEDFVNEVYEAYDLKTFNEQLIAHTIDVILMDIRLQGTNGMELLSLLKKRNKDHPKVIAVTGLEGVELMINLLKVGVHGIVFKLDGYLEILKTITAVLKSEGYFPERILKIIQTNAHCWDSVPPVVLSFQEKELLKAIASGMTTKEIAVSLKMTESTIETYRIRLIKKVGLTNTAALLAYSYRNGIL
jgi:DNA-binding NarL/FixJ family response regulator